MVNFHDLGVRLSEYCACTLVLYFPGRRMTEIFTGSIFERGINQALPDRGRSLPVGLRSLL